MLSAEAIAKGLEKAQKTVDGWTACCPAHEDKNPSLSLKEGSAGKILVHCHAGCSQNDVIDALKQMGLWHENKSDHSNTKQRKKSSLANKKNRVTNRSRPDFKKLLGREPQAVYDYNGPSGEIIGFVVRLEHDGVKSFRPVTTKSDQNGNSVWSCSGFGDVLPIYNLQKLAKRAQDPVLIVEGEKTADAASKLVPSHVVLSWPGGSSAHHKVDWSILRGRKVVLWPDADTPGHKAMLGIARLLDEAGARNIRKVKLPDALPKGWDLADAIPEGFDIFEAISQASEVDLTLGQFILGAKELLDLKYPEQEFIIEEFMPTQSLSMIYAERGIGKTWLCMTLALAIARGDNFMCYKVPEPRRVLYIDGEMALSELQSRQKALEPNPPEFLEFLPSELLYKNDRPLNLQGLDDQNRILETLSRRSQQGRAPELIILDNLSSLTQGIDENSNSDLDGILKFLMGLRHHGYSVLLVHHAGKNKTQRGASRREDLLNLSIQLRKPDKNKDNKYSKGATSFHDGAHFILEFDKVRGKIPNPQMLDLKLQEIDKGRVEWLMDDTPHASRQDQVLRFVVEKKPMQQSEIAEEFGVSAGRASQICKALREAGFLELDENDRLRITRDGAKHLVHLWPELSDAVQYQDELPI